jgi:DNA-binding GntR family transcriptional regulator
MPSDPTPTPEAMRAANMLDQITGDMPPSLLKWSSRDWMNLHSQFHALLAKAARVPILERALEMADTMGGEAQQRARAEQAEAERDRLREKLHEQERLELDALRERDRYKAALQRIAEEGGRRCDEPWRWYTATARAALDRESDGS